MKGLLYVSRMESMVNKVKEGMKLPHMAGQDAHTSAETEHWIPIFSDGVESAMLSCDTDPKSWKEALASYNATEWVEVLKEEMDSLCAHEVFTLIPKSSIPQGHRVVSRGHTATGNTMKEGKSFDGRCKL